MIGALGNFSNPSAGLDEVQDLYIHGYVSARLFRGGSSGENAMAVCVSATIVDGLVLSLYASLLLPPSNSFPPVNHPATRTPFTHSYNYRSAIVHGTAAPVTDVDEKLYAMEKITEQVLAGRWERTRVPPTKAELDSTGILRVKITAASAKVKRGGPNETREDLKDSELVERVWTGVVPTYTVHGEPVPCGGGRAKEVPEYVRATLGKRNEDAKRTAEEAVKA
jgi:hypothetical protein